MKFKVGDIVVGNDLSDYEYSITCKKNDFVGKVVKILPQGTVVVKTVGICKELIDDIGITYFVDPKYFELKQRETTEDTNSISIEKVIQIIEDDTVLSNKMKRHTIKRIKEKY